MSFRTMQESGVSRYITRPAPPPGGGSYTSAPGWDFAPTKPIAGCMGCNDGMGFVWLGKPEDDPILRADEWPAWVIVVSLGIAVGGAYAGYYMVKKRSKSSFYRVLGGAAGWLCATFVNRNVVVPASLPAKKTT